MKTTMRSIHDEEGGSSADAASRADHCDSLTRRKDELEMVLGAAGIGYCRVDDGPNLLSADSQFKALFGCAPDAELTWAHLETRIAPDDRVAFAAALRAAFEQGTALDLAVKTSWPQAGASWVSLRGRAVADVYGRRENLLLVARDASNEQRTLASLAAAIAGERRSRDVAEAANRSKDEFLSVVSHELRSPLNAILGWNRILAIKRGDDAEVSAVAPRIERSAKAQLRMVNDLLDLGRIGTGKLRISARQLKLSALVSVAIDAIRPMAAQKEIEVLNEVGAHLSPLMGDPDRLNQVVANLLSNALKFTPRGGRVTVRLRQAEGRAELSVIDTGQGICPDLLPHIFDRFRQGDSSTTRGAGGLGLGLTIVREIVALHGGSVSAQSEGPGLGSTFVVTLPSAHVPATPAGQTNAEPYAGKRMQQLAGLAILVVDDEADARAVVTETLRLEGADVTVADSVRAALEHLQAPAARFDILITDIGMPEEDGYSLVRKLRALQAGERTVAIALTGYASHADIEAAIDAGFDLHVAKPVDFDSLVPMIRRLASAH